MLGIIVASLVFFLILFCTALFLFKTKEVLWGLLGLLLSGSFYYVAILVSVEYFGVGGIAHSKITEGLNNYPLAVGVPYKTLGVVLDGGKAIAVIKETGENKPWV